MTFAAELAQQQGPYAAGECNAPSTECGRADTTPDRFGGGGKQLSTLRALLAIHGGHVVHELPDGGFLVCWRGISRECRDLGELGAHAWRVGALK